VSQKDGQRNIALTVIDPARRPLHGSYPETGLWEMQAIFSNSPQVLRLPTARFAP